MKQRPFRLAALAAFSLVLLACGRAPAAAARGEPAASRSGPSPAPAAAAQGQLAHVRPPAPPCGAPRATLKALVERSDRAFDADDYDRALACAEDALELAPRAVPALHARAAALTALERWDEAKLAYARALAEDPDDPETLRGAADLYVLRAGSEADGLELGRAYALRGARRALRQGRPARTLAADLYLLAATAENELGHNRDALEHAGDALRLGAPEADARFERGVALFELCRFPEARTALERVVALAPEDAWAQHYLGLAYERLGDARKAAALATRAQALSPDDFPPPVELSRSGFDKEVRRAVASLPASEQQALERVPLEVVDLPALDDLTAVDPPLSPSILGLYRGPPEGERCTPEDGDPCRSIVVYRKNLERWARSRDELSEQVKVTLLHELGHLHGESDEQLRARGLE